MVGDGEPTEGADERAAGADEVAECVRRLGCVVEDDEPTAGADEVGAAVLELLLAAPQPDRASTREAVAPIVSTVERIRDMTPTVPAR